MFPFWHEDHYDSFARAELTSTLPDEQLPPRPCAVVWLVLCAARVSDVWQAVSLASHFFGVGVSFGPPEFDPAG